MGWQTSIRTLSHAWLAPTEAGDYSPEWRPYLAEQPKHPKIVALGEIGLDYHWMTQRCQVFRRQIQLSKDLVPLCGAYT